MAEPTAVDESPLSSSEIAQLCLVALLVRWGPSTLTPHEVIQTGLKHILHGETDPKTGVITLSAVTPPPPE